MAGQWIRLHYLIVADKRMNVIVTDSLGLTNDWKG